MRRRAVLVCLAAGGRTLGAYRGEISELCTVNGVKYVVVVWEKQVGG